MEIFRLNESNFWWALPASAFLLCVMDFSSTILSASRYGLHLESNPRIILALGMPLYKLILIIFLIGMSFAFSTLLIMYTFKKFDSALPELYGRLIVSAQSSVVLNNIIILFLGFSYINNQEIFFPIVVWTAFILINKKYLRIIITTLFLSYSTTALLYIIFDLSNFQYFALPLFLNLAYTLPVRSLLKSIPEFDKVRV